MSEHAYGVVYNPSNIGGQAAVVLTGEYLNALGVKFIRITWVDYTNSVRYRVVPRAYFRKLLESARPGVSLTSVALGLVALTVSPGFDSGPGEHHYVLDASSFRLASYAPGHATVFGFFQNKLPTPEHGLTMPHCPRALLSRIAQRAKAEAGVSYLVGFESEFILLSATTPKIAPVNSADWSVSSKLPSGSVEAAVLEEIAEKLIAAGIELQMYHAEAAPGQYEVITGPLPPLEAADALVCTRETIYNVASNHGLRATFAPKLYPNSCGSAAHTHISVHQMDPPAQAARSDEHLAPTMTSAERSFLQGVLSHAPAICALTLPTTFSYARVADGIWSGGTYASWGTDQREAPVRLCGAAGQHHFEVRFVDGTASPYLALAALLCAGTDAVAAGTLLESGDCATPVALMTSAERRAAGVENVGRLPTTLNQARKNLAADEGLKKALGDEFVEKYICVNSTLEEMLQVVGEPHENLAITKLISYY